MGADEIEFFFHEHGQKPRVIVARRGDPLKAALIANQVVAEGGDGLVYVVGECVEALEESAEIEDGCDEHEAIDISLSIEILEIERHKHVHRHRCRRIAVEVHFGGETKRHRFSPATPIRVVTAWARKKFPKLDPAAASNYVLQICNTTKEPRGDEHLGEVVPPGDCSICFNLVPEVTPQG